MCVYFSQDSQRKGRWAPFLRHSSSSQEEGKERKSNRKKDETLKRGKKEFSNFLNWYRLARSKPSTSLPARPDFRTDFFEAARLLTKKGEPLQPRPNPAHILASSDLGLIYLSGCLLGRSKVLDMHTRRSSPLFSGDSRTHGLRQFRSL